MWSDNNGNTHGPLAGLRVVEFGHVLAAPICGLMLSDMGADVIKVERPPHGDSQRWDVAAADTVGPFSASFFVLNRGKRSIALDLKSPQDFAVAQELVEGADVVLENYRPGSLDRLGLGYPAVAATRPDIIYCTISGFGASGPWSHRPGFDLVAQAMSGIMSFTGPEDGSEPVKCGPPVTDVGAGLLATVGILAALHRRTATGQGEYVDTSLLEAGTMFTYTYAALATASGAPPVPMGSAHPLYSPYEAYRAADGWFVLGTANEDSWKRLTSLVGLPELAVDDRFNHTDARIRHRDELKTILQSRFANRTRDDWIGLFDEHGIPAGPILDLLETLDHPQTAARDMAPWVPGPDGHPVRAIGCPIKFQHAGRPDYTSAPLLTTDHAHTT